MCVHSGHSLVPMDKHGLSDPYCLIYENSRQVVQVLLLLNLILSPRVHVVNKIKGTSFKSFPRRASNHAPANIELQNHRLQNLQFRENLQNECVVHEINSLKCIAGKEQLSQMK